MTQLMTIKRLRAYAILMAATLWSVWVVDLSIEGPVDRLGKVKGTDFLQFYAAGSLVRDRRWNDLYDVRALYGVTRAIAPTSQETLFLPVQSPQLALLFAPFARFPYPVALTIWLGTIGVLYAGSCLALGRICDALKDHRRLVVSSCLAYPGFYTLVINGQTSGLSLVCLVGALLGIRDGRWFTAGLALGLLGFKPHWAAAAAAVFFVAREWRIVTGIIVAACGQFALTWFVVGSSVMNAYGRVLQAIPKIADLLEPKPGDSLRSYWGLIAPWKGLAWALYAATAFAAAVIAASIWRRHPAFEVRCSAVVLAIVLVSPHVLPYDLILLGPALLLMANWFAKSGPSAPGKLSVALLGSFLAPLMTPLPALIRQQFSVGATAVALLLLWRTTGSEAALGTHPEASHGDAEECAGVV